MEKELKNLYQGIFIRDNSLRGSHKVMDNTFGKMVASIRESLGKVLGKEVGYGGGQSGMEINMRGNMFEIRSKDMEYTIGILEMCTKVIILRI
jgi:hypothetical protein